MVDVRFGQLSTQLSKIDLSIAEPGDNSSSPIKNVVDRELSKRKQWILKRVGRCAKIQSQTTQPTKPGPLHRRRAKADATNGKGKGRRPLVRGKSKPLMSDGRGKGDDVEPDHPSDEKRKAQKVATMKRWESDTQRRIRVQYLRSPQTDQRS